LGVYFVKRKVEKDIDKMINKSNKTVNILGVGFSGTSQRYLLADIEKKLDKKAETKKFYIVTPNPEIVLKATDDSLLNNILNNADYSIADGIGIIAAAKYFSLPRPDKIIKRIFVLLKQGFRVGLSIIFDQKWLQSELSLIKGRRVFEDLVIMSDKKAWKLVLIGDEKGNAEKAGKILASKYKGAKIFYFGGPRLNFDGNPQGKEEREKEKSLLEKINKIFPDLIFIGFGAPKQEKWLYRQYNNLNFRGAMVVGGALDYYNGTRKVVPTWIDDLNLEWLWRLVTGSQKPGRIIKASLEFPLRVFLTKLLKN
jgi:N-acetylglucosaminyldiphosphoundecaprenol N-acetyl-beta-D-mannosaminyltransferase